MSRTYRRLRGSQDWKRWMLSDWRLERDFPGLPHLEQLRRATARYHSERTMTMASTPSAWTNTFMTRPQRAEVRRLTHQVLGLPRAALVEAPIFPHPKRPHHYYW